MQPDDCRRNVDVLRLYIHEPRPDSKFAGGHYSRQIHLDGGLTTHLVIYGLIPVLGLLSISFPEALRGPVSWLGSLLGHHT
jgi:hypothetical protein